MARDAAAESGCSRCPPTADKRRTFLRRNAMTGISLADGRKLLAPLAIGALLLSAATISAKADTDNITKTSTVPVDAHSMVGAVGAGCTATSFSFDISWV